MPFYLWLIIIHPALVTILVVGILIAFLTRTRFWRPYKWYILGSLCLAYAIDAAFAWPRIAYGRESPSQAVIREIIPLPQSLVIVHAGCRSECQQLLANGKLDEVILVARDYSRAQADRAPVRYRAGWTETGTCPRERRGYGMIPDELLRRGFCPLIEPAELPRDGIFIVEEHFSSPRTTGQRDSRHDI